MALDQFDRNSSDLNFFLFRLLVSSDAASPPRILGTATVFPHSDLALRPRVFCLTVDCEVDFEELVCQSRTVSRNSFSRLTLCELEGLC